MAATMETYLRTLADARAASGAAAWAEAIPLWAAAAEANPVEGRLWAQLADALYQGREYARALVAYERQCALGVGLPAEVSYRRACCHALLGDRAGALAELERSFALGYRHVDQARTDPDLAAIREEPRFRELVVAIDTGTLGRDDGWRFDLALLDREIRRLGYAPFRFVAEADFAARVAALHEAIPRLTDGEIVVGLMRLLRLVDDGHSRLRDLTALPEFREALPVQFYLFEEGLFIVAAAPAHEDLLGAQVLAIGEQTIEVAFAALEPLISRDNAQWVKLMTPYHLREVALLHSLGLVPEARRVSLALRDRAGRERRVTLDADTSRTDIWFSFPAPEGWRFLPETLPEPLPHSLQHVDAFQWFTYLEESRAVYFQFNRVRDMDDEPLAAFTDRLFRFIAENRVDRLVIDLRWNNGGNTFLEMPLLHRLLACDQINRWGKLFVIIGRRTFSAAQNFASLIERHAQAIFVGEPTGSRPNFVGESIPFTLPYSGITGTLSDLYWQNSWPLDHRTWIAPRLYTPPTFAAYAANRDPALEAAFAYADPSPVDWW